MKPLLFGAGAFLAYAIVVNMPRLPVRAEGGAFTLMIVLLVLAYRAGVQQGRQTVSDVQVDASADARAEQAQGQAVQVFVGPSVHASGAAPGASPAAAAAGTEADVAALPPWVGPPVSPVEQLLAEAGALDDLPEGTT